MPEISLPKPIFVVSDGTGDTAETVVRAALHQFNGYLVHIQVFPNVNDRDQLERLIQRAAKEKALVATTLVRPDMRSAVQELGRQHRVRTVELLGHLLSQMTTFLDAAPEGVPGRMHQADDRYFERVEAVEFTVKADDGKEPRLMKQADILLLGVSRTSKTPLSVFLAHKGFKVSNVPIVLDRPLPPILHEVDQNRIFALTIDPESLHHIRYQRIENMRMPGKTNYSDMDYILADLDWAEDQFRRNPTWPVIDVTRKAVEETAAIIIKILGERGLTTDTRESGQL
jgi:regulator of PEP synthase PpsR (kinase-PPPase family)